MSEVESMLDTNVVSYLMKGGSMAEMYKPFVQGQLLSISFITVGELYFGAEKAGWGKRRRKELEATLKNFVVIPYDHKIARCYGKLVAEKRKKGNAISANDAWIAACAVRHSTALITHNASDFEDIAGLRIITATAS